MSGHEAGAGPRPIAVVVGAGGQIGAAIVAELAAAHRLALIDIDADRLAAVGADLPDALVFAIDAAATAEMDAAFAAISSAGTVAAAAIAVGTTTGGSLHELDDERWQQTLDSNLGSVFRALRASVRVLSGGGAICVVGSVHAAAPQPGYPAYAVAKAGVHVLARQVAAEYGHRGIRVNIVTPGWTRTAHTESRLSPQDAMALDESTPLQGLVEPRDVASAVAYLLSPGARHITGADVVVDAGAALLGGATVLRAGYRASLGLPDRLV